VLAFDRDPERVGFTAASAARAGLGERVLAFVADITAIPLADGTAAAVACGEVLEHVPHDRQALRELARVVVPGGVIAVTVPAGAQRFGPTDRSAGHLRRYDESDLVGLLAGAGLRQVALRGWGFPFGRLYDHVVLAPAQAARGRSTGRRLAQLGRWPLVHAIWRALFTLDERLPAGERGSGWLALARRAAELEPDDDHDSAARSVGVS
jgi:SAM-dependent methyltransferase